MNISQQTGGTTEALAIRFPASLAMLLRKHQLLWIHLAVLIGVLIAVRGLVGGTGTYQIYGDSALPASDQLLRAISSSRLHLWSEANLGHRILYPAEYPVAASILALLRIGVPASLISRLLPVTMLVIGAYGMMFLIRRLFATLGHVAYGPSSPSGIPAQVAMVGVGLAYALNPITFTQLVMGHYLYLVAMAAFGWAGGWWLLEGRRWSLPLMGVAFAIMCAQIQFALMAPLVLLALAIVVRRKGMYRRLVVGSAIGLLPHLPWLIPLLVYSPGPVNTSAFSPPGTVEKFSIAPLNGLRGLGYVTPFFERSIGTDYFIWVPLSFMLSAIAVAFVLTRRGRRFLPLLCLVLLVLVYQAGPRLGLDSVWDFIGRTPLGLVFRERFHLSFITLASFLIIGAVATWHVGRATSSAAALLMCCALAGSAWAFADGHLGPYGDQRQEFASDNQVYGWLSGRAHNAVLSMPSGSISKRDGWRAFGRDPFFASPGVLDTEGDESAAALPAVRRLASLLNSLGNESLVSQQAQLLSVDHVLIRPNLVSLLPDEPMTVSRNLYRANYRPVDIGAGVTAWVHSWRPFGLHAFSGVLLTDGDPLELVHAGQNWRAAVATTPNSLNALFGGAASIPELTSWPSASVQLGSRPVLVRHLRSSLTILEPVLLSSGREWILGQRRYESGLLPRSSLRFRDGSPIPLGTHILVVDSPITGVYPTKLRQTRSLRQAGRYFESLVPPVQDVSRTDDRTPAQAGLSASLGRRGRGHALRVQAEAHAAGVLIRLPAKLGTYELSLDARFVSGLPARISVISNGERTLATKVISSTSGWSRERLTFQVPPEAKDLYLYLYVYGPDDGTKSVWLFDDPNLNGRAFPLSLVLTGTTPEARQADPFSLNLRTSGREMQPDVFWIASDWGADPWWQLRLSSGTAVRLPWRFGGYGNMWEVEIPAGVSVSVTAVYLPDRLFRMLLTPTWLLMMLLVGASVLREGWISRRE